MSHFNFRIKIKEYFSKEIKESLELPVFNKFQKSFHLLTQSKTVQTWSFFVKTFDFSIINELKINLNVCLKTILYRKNNLSFDHDDAFN